MRRESGPIGARHVLGAPERPWRREGGGRLAGRRRAHMPEPEPGPGGESEGGPARAGRAGPPAPLQLWGLLPWLAAFLRRAFFLRRRFEDMRSPPSGRTVLIFHRDMRGNAASNQVGPRRERTAHLRRD